ncbi:anaerobic sulfatase maturase [Desulfovibrio sp. JC010]|uniref:anaerobic sulfatase maturase n=1 Tax=Desulfovibrio sp. JC010 TaxID=2593641 RepID=UPI0013D4F382|nr:anaerobic sulfatase maturase [Desulfovibrio sp. JC010]NDV27681.1 anaerobic sulfatase maturase [Desulfovibrio sp. JC010]
MPYSIIAKPVGPRCNLRCTYCYYLEKDVLFAESSAGPNSRIMSGEILENYIRQMFESPGNHPIEFVWQGGEPLLAGIPFYENVIRIQCRYAGTRPFSNVIQTNGTLLDDEWGNFMARHRILAGVSLDGPEEIHDTYRVDTQGNGSFKRVMNGLDVLRKHGVDYNILATINSANAPHPLKTYQFLKDQSQGFLQFVPVVKEDKNSSSGVTPWSVTAQQFGEFYVAIYDEWVRNDVGNIFVQLFDATLGNHLNAPPPVCYYAENCPKTGLLEHTGDVYACDHFVSLEFKRGNILRQSLAEMLGSEEQTAFRCMKSELLPQECRDCSILFACKGECPKNRFLPAENGTKNYLCAGYKSFFEHSAPTMRKMAGLVRSGRLAQEIMKSHL